MEDVFVLAAVRTPIGKYGGGLASVPPCDLAAKVVREAVKRAGVSADDVGHVVFGNVIHTEVRDMYLSRVAAVNGGLNIETPALTVNRLCGSGMQAIVSAAQARLRPAFAKDGTVTAGNASGINDAAAAVVLASESFVASGGFAPLGRLAGYGHAGVEPRIMGMGPVPATRKALDRTGLKVGEIDVFEVNEAFAAQALAVARELDLPSDRTNPNGSGISLGHPVGASGAILVVKSLYELKRTGGRYALNTMCIGGGQGIATIFERV
jgi:acetyl-CoA acetyltransferase